MALERLRFGGADAVQDADQLSLSEWVEGVPPPTHCDRGESGDGGSLATGGVWRTRTTRRLEWRRGESGGPWVEGGDWNGDGGSLADPDSGGDDVGSVSGDDCCVAMCKTELRGVKSTRV